MARFEPPTARVPRQAAGRPVSCAWASAMNAAAPSWRVATTLIPTASRPSSRPRKLSPGTVNAHRTPARRIASANIRPTVIGSGGAAGSALGGLGRLGRVGVFGLGWRVPCATASGLRASAVLVGLRGVDRRDVSGSAVVLGHRLGRRPRPLDGELVLGGCDRHRRAGGSASAAAAGSGWLELPVASSASALSRSVISHRARDRRQHEAEDQEHDHEAGRATARNASRPSIGSPTGSSGTGARRPRRARAAAR